MCIDQFIHMLHHACSTLIIESFSTFVIKCQFVHEHYKNVIRDRHVRMVVGFTTTFVLSYNSAISVAGLWFSPGTSTNKTDPQPHDITEILLTVALNTITLTSNP